METKTQVNWAMLCHLGGLALYIGIPFGNIIVPLAIWLMKRNKDAAVMEEGKKSLNFNISYTIYGVIAGLLCYLLIGFLLLPILFIAHIILAVRATLQVNKGQPGDYPLTLKIIK